MKKSVCAAVAAIAVLCFGPACETYDSPPRPSIEGLEDGVLSDREAPIVIVFSEPIVPDSLKIKVIQLQTDVEGNLLDEDDDPDTLPNEYFGFDPITLNNFGGTGTLDDSGTRFTIADGTFPLGTSLAVIIEPGLQDAAGKSWQVRQRLPFSYGLSCDAAAMGTDRFPTGSYFFVANITEPISTQIQLWARIEVDTATGNFRGQFTNADRNADPDRCSPPCDATQACRTLPNPECVTPSEEAGTEDEYPDWLPNNDPPTGYSFTVGGCVVATGETGVAFVNAPADVEIQQPAVSIKGIQLVSSFDDDGGVFRGSGSVTADTVLLGTTESGAAKGTLVGRLVPDEEVPDGIPAPPPE